MDKSAVATPIRTRAGRPQGNARRLISLVLAAATLYAAPAHALINMQLPGGGGDFYLKTKKTFQDVKFDGIYRQQYDFSCGSAALASMLAYNYNRNVTERDVLKAMYMIGDQTKIRREGFSLLDMKNYLESIGLQANGYREKLDKLQTVGIPGIALINHKGYLHFVLIKAVTNREVLVGDSALGNKVYSREKFESMWNGILFVVTNEMDVARASLAGGRAWKVFPRARFDNQLIDNELSSYTMYTTRSPGLYN